MKKVMAVVLALMLFLSVACASAEVLAGGWSIAETTDLTDERSGIFEKAMENLVGVNYVPVAYLGSQLVAGTNHCYLCKATVVYPNATPVYALVYVYQDLEGHATILQIKDIDIAALSTADE